VEYRFKKKDGNYIWLRVKRIVLRDENGNLDCIIGDMIDITSEKLAEHERAKLNERLLLIQKRESKKKIRVSLTDKEKLVLWGLCEHPLLNDEELSSKLDLKRSTLTAIRNRLKKRGWFNLVYLPNFYKLGCQFFSFFNGKMGNGDLNLSPVKDFSNVILKNYQNDKFFGIFVADRYIAFKKFLESFSEMNRDLFRLGLNEDSFFYDLDNVKLKNFSGILERLFGLDVKNGNGTYNFKEKKDKLNLNEKRVLHMMAKNSEMSSSEIAKRVWISKPTVIKIRRRILNEKFIYPIIIPNFRKLGFSFVGRFSFDFDSKVMDDVLGKDDYRVILQVRRKKQFVKFMLFLSEEEYLDEVDLVQNRSRKKGVYFKLDSEVFAIQKKGKNFDLESFVSELLFKDDI
jgi:DNA-binding MarR family transcriptional regulator